VLECRFVYRHERSYLPFAWLGSTNLLSTLHTAATCIGLADNTSPRELQSRTRIAVCVADVADRGRELDAWRNTRTLQCLPVELSIFLVTTSICFIRNIPLIMRQLDHDREQWIYSSEPVQKRR
jgi:hypothetical protein